MPNTREDSIRKNNKRLRLATPKRNWKRFESVVQQRHKGKRHIVHRSRRVEYKVYKPAETGKTLRNENTSNESSKVLGWLESMIKRGRSVLSSLNEDEKAFDLELQEEARQSLAHERLVESVLNEDLEAPVTTSAGNGYGTDTSFKNFNSILHNSLADTAEFDEGNSNEELFEDQDEEAELDDRATRFADSIGEINVPGSSFAILEDVENQDAEKGWNSGFEGNSDASLDDVAQPENNQNEDDEDIIELISSSDQPGISEEEGNQRSNDENWGEQAIQLSQDEEPEEDEMVDEESQEEEQNEHQFHIRFDPANKADLDGEDEPMYESDNTSGDEHGMSHVQIGEEEIGSQSEEAEEEASPVEIEDQLQIRIGEQDDQEDINESDQQYAQYQRDSYTEDPGVSDGVYDSTENGVIRHSPPSTIKGDGIEAFKGQPETSNDFSCRPEAAQIAVEGSETPIIAGSSSTENVEPAKREIYTDQSINHSPSNSPFLSGVDACDYKAIANAVINQIPLQAEELDVGVENEDGAHNDDVNIDSTRVIKASYPNQTTRHDTSHNDDQDDEDEGFVQTVTKVTKTDTDSGVNGLIIHETSTVEQEHPETNSFSLDETTIYHSFVDEDTDGRTVDHLSPIKDIKKDSKVKIVFTESVYSSSSYDENDNVAEEEPDYISPLTENPFQHASDGEDKDILKRTLASLEGRTDNGKIAIGTNSVSAAEENRSQTNPSEPRGLLNVVHCKGGHDIHDDDRVSRSSYTGGENFGPFPADIKLHGGLRTRESSVTYMSNAIAARDETASASHDKSSQYNGQTASRREEHGSLSHLKEEEISEYLSAVLEASGRIEDGTGPNEASTDFYIEEMNIPEMNIHPLVQTEPIIEANESIICGSPARDTVDAIYHEMKIIEDITECRGTTRSDDEIVVIIQTTPIIEVPFASHDFWPAQSIGERTDSPPATQFYDEDQFAASRKRTFSTLEDDASVDETLTTARQNTTEWFAKVSDTTTRNEDSEVDQPETSQSLEAVHLAAQEQQTKIRKSALSSDDHYDAPSAGQNSTLFGHLATGSLPKKLISSPVRAISSIVTGMKEVGSVASSFVKSLDLMNLEDDTQKQETPDEHCDKVVVKEQKTTLDKSSSSENMAHQVTEEIIIEKDIVEKKSTEFTIEEVALESSTVESDTAKPDIKEQTITLESNRNDKYSSNAINEQNISDDNVNEDKASISQAHDEIVRETSDDGCTIERQRIAELEVNMSDADGSHIDQGFRPKSPPHDGNFTSENSRPSNLPVTFDDKEKQDVTIYVEVESSSSSDENLTLELYPADSLHSLGEKIIENDEGQKNSSGDETSEAEEKNRCRNEVTISNVRALQQLAKKISSAQPASSDEDEKTSNAPAEESDKESLPIGVEVDTENQIDLKISTQDDSQADVSIIKERDPYPVESTLISDFNVSKIGNRNDSGLVRDEALSNQPQSVSASNFEGHVLPANLPSDPPSEESSDPSDDESEDNGNMADLKGDPSEYQGELEKASPNYYTIEGSSDEGEGREIPVKVESKACEAPVPVPVQVEESPEENIIEDRDEDIDSAVENENVTSGLLQSSSTKPQKRKSTLPALQKQTGLTKTRKKAKLGKKDDKRSKKWNPKNKNSKAKKRRNQREKKL